MKTFVQFLFEVRTATDITKKTKSFINAVLPNNGRKFNPEDSDGEHIGTVKGHHIYKHVSPLNKRVVTYSAHNPESGKSTVAVSGIHHKGVLSDLRLAASEDNKFPAHELYHHLLHHDHVKALVADHQSPGGKKVWERLAKKKNIGIHGWDPKKNKPVNIKFGEDETHEEPSKNKKKYDAINPDQDVVHMQLVAHKK